VRTIAIANQKGGCGKTTVSVNFSSSLAFLGKKVLLIDLDPQGHASLGLGVKSDNISRSIYDVLDDSGEQSFGIRDVRIILSDHLHLIPSEVVLSAMEQKLAGTPERENRLLQKLVGLDAEYDFIVIDCPPNLGLLTFNALRAAQELIIPVECSTFSLHGLSKILETVQLLDEALQQKLKVRALLNDFDPRTRFSRKIQEELERLFTNQLCRTVIHHSVRLREAAACGKPITDYDRQSVVFKDFLNLSAEILEGETAPKTAAAVAFSVFDVPDLNESRDPSEFFSPEEERFENRSILFTVRAAGARYVQIAGDFTHWVPEELVPSVKAGGLWRKLYHLQPGIYKYKFIIDGEWMTDPQNPRSEPNPYGGTDSILEVSVQGASLYGK